jgi:TonB family protein
MNKTPMHAVLLAAAMAALPLQAADSTVKHVGNFVALPADCKAPAWSAGALQQNQYGMVSMKLLIAADGSVSELQPAGSSGFEQLDRLTHDAIRKCIFKPTLVDGKPVAAWSRFNYVWSADETPTQLYDAEAVRAAARIYRRRALAGDQHAQYALGDIYRTGHGFATNFEEAAGWYGKASAQGHPGAQYNLAMMYLFGVGVPKNVAEAAQWMGKAAEQGHPDAQDLIGVLTENGSGVAKDDNLAAAWYRKAADQGNGHGLFNLARCHEFGIGVGQDMAAATALYTQARDKGVTDDRVTMMLAGTLPKAANAGDITIAAKPAMTWNRAAVKQKAPGLSGKGGGGKGGGKG